VGNPNRPSGVQERDRPGPSSDMHGESTSGSVTKTPPARPGRSATLRTALRAWISAAGLPIIGMVVALTVWALVKEIFDIKSLFLPSPAEIADAFIQLPDYLMRRAWETLWVTLLGFALAAVGGLIVAILLTASQVVERAVLPLVVALNAVPKVALVPLLIMWLGRGELPKVLLVVLICFFPIVVSTMAGLTSTPADLGELVRSLSASRAQAFVKVRFPWALPHVFVGMKVAMPLAMIGAVVAEISNPNSGLGAVVVNSQPQLNTPLAFAAIALLAAMSVSLFYLVVAAERLLLPWVRETSG